MSGWVVFDYGAVLCTEQPAADQRALVAAAGVDPDDAAGTDAFWAAYWRERRPYDRGDTDPAAYWRLVLGRELPPAELTAVDDADVAGWSHPYAGTLALLDPLSAAGTSLALLSNAPTTLADAIDRMEWTRRIPHRFYSCRLRASKPDPAVYGAVLARIGAEPAAVTFVDDRPDNVAGAAAIGMRALLFTDPASLAADLGVEPAH